MADLSKLGVDLVRLKNSPGYKDPETGIQYMPNHCGFIQPAALTVGDATALYSSRSAVDTEFPNDKDSQGLISLEAQAGDVSTSAYFGLAGWSKDGSPQAEVFEVLAADSTDDVDSTKKYGFLPAVNAVTFITKTDTNNRAFEILNADDEEIGYIASSSNSDAQPQIVVPPHGIAVLNHLKGTATAAQNFTVYLKELDLYNDNSRTLYTSATLNTGGTTSETFLDMQYEDEQMIFEGGKYGKLIYIDVTGDHASSAGKVEIQYDLFARWFASLESKFQTAYNQSLRTAVGTDHTGDTTGL